jgi:glycosyltransferase involved in cell wall biosynthesis
MPPQFSVVLPTHNRPELLAEAIASVAEQSLNDWELIVVDDASEPYLKASDLDQQARRPVKLLRHEHSRGGAATKNTGVEAATGVFLAFLDDDDTWDPSYLEEASQVFEKYPYVTTLFMGTNWFGNRAQWGKENQDHGMQIIMDQTENQQLALTPQLIEFKAGLFAALLERIPIPFQRPVLRRKDFSRIGKYRADCLLWDCDFALKAALNGPCVLLDKPLYQMRASGQGYSSQIRRIEEQIQSNLEIKNHLRAYPAVLGTSHELELKKALHQSWFDYAWWLCKQQRYQDAGEAIRKSWEYNITLPSVKLFAKVIMNRMIPNRTLV